MANTTPSNLKPATIIVGLALTAATFFVIGYAFFKGQKTAQK